jgi:dTDP-glucose 4,6-dehydratase
MNPLASDLDHVLARTQGLWEELREQRIFITGGTGFVGCWLLESFCWANDRLHLGAQATVLTRDPDAFRTKAPHLASHPSVTLIAGDVRTFDFPAGRFGLVVHAATDASAKLNAEDPLRMFDTIVAGTRRALDFTVQSGAKKLLLISSGAVYGRQPPDLAHVPEDYAGAPDPADPRSAYGEGKRVAELLCAAYARQHGIAPTIARCFAFLGPYLPLDTHFAAGNFIRDGQAGGPIRVTGDGTAVRSYLYAADLASWLWTVVLRGSICRPYNVGSEDGLTLADLAHRVAKAAGGCGITVARRSAGGPSDRYVPGTVRARTELGLQPWTGTDDAIVRTLAWWRTAGARPGIPAAG